jgi:predicted outer membrane protein
MIINNRFAAVMASGVLLALVAQSPAEARSSATEAFLANVGPNVDFLDRSSRMALDNSANKQLKTFAFSEAREQTLSANALDTWVDAENAASTVVAATTPVASDALQTGRSVAIDRPAPVVDNRLPAGQEDLDNLYGMNGHDFDDMYKAKQADALAQLQTSYQTYIATGDDADLKALATRELPKINRRLAELRRL